VLTLQHFADSTFVDLQTRLIGLLVSRKIVPAPLHPGLHLRIVVSAHSKALLRKNAIFL
jgi:hypothetical protein